MSAKLHLKLEARPEELQRINAALEELGEQEEWPPKLMFRVNLVLEEVGLNVMTHGRKAGARHLEVLVTAEPDSVTIELVDDGPPFDPLDDAPVPDTDAPVEGRPIGGLGIHLVREMMDEVRYRYEDGKNRLTLVTATSA